MARTDDVRGREVSCAGGVFKPETEDRLLCEREGVAFAEERGQFTYSDEKEDEEGESVLRWDFVDVLLLLL